MNVRELRAQWRRDVDDAVEPYLWDDRDFLTWLNEAEREACARARLLIDSSDQTVCYVTAAAGDPWVPFDPRIVSVMRVKPDSQAAIYPCTSMDLDMADPNWESSPAGPEIRAIVKNLESFKLRTWPALTASKTLNLTVQRLPLCDLAADKDVPEIPVQYHLKLLDWVKFQAYSVDDVDKADPQKAEKHEARFTHEFGTRSAIGEMWDRHWGGRELVTGYFA